MIAVFKFLQQLPGARSGVDIPASPRAMDTFFLEPALPSDSLTQEAAQSPDRFSNPSYLPCPLHGLSEKSRLGEGSKHVGPRRREFIRASPAFMGTRSIFAQQQQQQGGANRTAPPVPSLKGKITTLFKSPEGHPNALSVVPGGWWIAEQKSDNACLVDRHFGRLLKTVKTESKNPSGMTIGDGYIWMGANAAPLPEFSNGPELQNRRSSPNTSRRWSASARPPSISGKIEVLYVADRFTGPPGLPK